MNDPLTTAADLIERRSSGAILTHLPSGSRTVIDDSGAVLAGEEQAAQLTAAALTMIVTGTSGTVTDGDAEVFVEVIVPDPRLVVFGAGPIAEALCPMAAAAGFVVTVADPRPAFARVDRFPEAAGVLVGWPEDLVTGLDLDNTTFVVSLLHEARFEAELMPELLRSPVRYIGALGSKRTHAARVADLTAVGFDDDDIARIHGPVGLDIGAVTPAEIAVAIVAELVAARRITLA